MVGYNVRALGIVDGSDVAGVVRVRRGPAEETERGAGADLRRFCALPLARPPVCLLRQGRAPVRLHPPSLEALQGERSGGCSGVGESVRAARVRRGRSPGGRPSPRVRSGVTAERVPVLSAI